MHAWVSQRHAVWPCPINASGHVITRPARSAHNSCLDIHLMLGCKTIQSSEIQTWCRRFAESPTHARCLPQLGKPGFSLTPQMLFLRIVTHVGRAHTCISQSRQFCQGIAQVLEHLAQFRTCTCKEEYVALCGGALDASMRRPQIRFQATKVLRRHPVCVLRAHTHKVSICCDAGKAKAAPGQRPGNQFSVVT